MSDLIDRAALRAAMYEAAFETDSDEQKWDSGCWIKYTMFERIVGSMPTQPEQKKGKWIDLGVYECSVCHERSCCAGNYCPDCGADMRESNESGNNKSVGQ